MKQNVKELEVQKIELEVAMIILGELNYLQDRADAGELYIDSRLEQEEMCIEAQKIIKRWQDLVLKNV